MNETARASIWWWGGAAVGLILWVVTAFVLAWPTGWVHLLLVGAVFASVRAIVLGDRDRAG